MYLSDAIKVLARRWRLLLAGGLALLLMAVGVVLSVPTSYQASGRLVLLPPNQQVTDGGRTNPYLELPIGFTASLVADAVMTEDAHREMVAGGFEPEYAASVAESTGSFVGPLIEVTVQGSDPASAIKTRNELLRRLKDGLTLIQARESVPESQLIAAREFGVSKAAEAIAGSKLRALAVLVTVGGSTLLFMAFGVDREARRRSGRRRSTPAPGAEAHVQDLRRVQRSVDLSMHPEAATSSQGFDDYDPAGDTRSAFVAHSRHPEPGRGSASPTSVR